MTIISKSLEKNFNSRVTWSLLVMFSL